MKSWEFEGNCWQDSFGFNFDSLHLLGKSPWARGGPLELKRPTRYLELADKRSEEEVMQQVQKVGDGLVDCAF